MAHCYETDSNVSITINFDPHHKKLTGWVCNVASLYRCDTYKKTLQCPLLDSILEKKHLSP